MSIAQQIRNRIANVPQGYVFSYTEFLDVASTKQEAIVKTLNRLVEKDVLKKLAKGKYYKPEQTPFGELQPSQYEIVKDILESKNQPSGYLTGLSIYSTLGLTSQISYTIQIGKNDIRPKLKRGKYLITFVKQKNPITKKNIPLLQILDAIKNIRKIPDTTNKETCVRFMSLLKNLQPKEVEIIAKLALKYPPSTRSLLGALLDQAKIKFDREELKQSLNPITQYKLSGISKVISYAEDWNLVCNFILTKTI